MKKVISIFIALFLYQFGFTQQKITGTILDNENSTPVPFASVLSERGDGVITDSSGRFSISIRRSARFSDSILISAIGYEPRKIAVKDLMSNSSVLLVPKNTELEQVKVFASLKGDYRRFGYYRSWDLVNQGGEIGYIFDLQRTKFQLSMVQVKINHNFDTCWLKLHLRDVAVSGLGLPENDVLKKEVIVPVTIKYGLVEFVLDWEEISLPTKRVYVGFELLKCGNSTSPAPSFFFMGNAEGQNYFRESTNSIWKRGGEYTIYVRMFGK
jgi:hypothetical protein